MCFGCWWLLMFGPLDCLRLYCCHTTEVSPITYLPWAEIHKPRQANYTHWHANKQAQTHTLTLTELRSCALTQKYPPHPNDTHARTYTHTQFWTKTISIQFSVSNALPFTSHQLAMLCVSVCPDLLKWNWTLWGKLCQACPSDLSHSFSWT